jgi:uncharacterized membrane protein
MPMQVTTAPLFAADLTPPRRMHPTGLRLTIGLVVLLAVLPAAVMLGLESWMVAVLMSATVLGIGLTVYKSFDIGKRREAVTLFADKLDVMSVAANGAQTRVRFEPARVRLVIDRDINERALALKLRTPEGDTEIGAFLTPEERSSFAKAFGTALRKARA